MSDPKRLFEEGGELESILLSSAMDDAPRKGLGRKVHVALGMGGAAFGAGTASTTAAAASKAVPFLASLGVAKWAGIVAIGTSTLVGAAVVHRVAAPAPRPVSTSVTAHGSPSRAEARPVVPLPIDIPPPPPIAPPLDVAPPVASPAPVAAEPRAASPSVAAAHASPVAMTPQATPRPELADELALLDRAHQAIGAGDASLALATLDRYDLEFPSGDLGPAALFMRIQAYDLRHDDAKVAELGERFLGRYPDDPVARRVRGMMGR